VVEQPFRGRILQARVKNAVLKGKIAPCGEAEAARGQSAKKKPTLHRSRGFMVRYDSQQNRTVTQRGSLKTFCSRGREQALIILPESFLLYAQYFLDFLLIESNNRHAIDDSYRRALVTHIEQLLQRCPVGTHVLVNKIDSLLRKKLLLSVTGASPGLAINDHGFCHSTLLLRVRIISILPCLRPIANFSRPHGVGRKANLLRSSRAVSSSSKTPVRLLV
jgi:hypothetical protein